MSNHQKQPSIQSPLQEESSELNDEQLNKIQGTVGSSPIVSTIEHVLSSSSRHATVATGSTTVEHISRPSSRHSTITSDSYLSTAESRPRPQWTPGATPGKRRRLS